MFDLTMQDWQRQRADLQEQVRHPVQDYAPGSPRLEQLYEQMAQAQRYEWPSTLIFNV